MVTAIVLIRMDKGRIHDAAQELAALRGISEVYSVAGEYDLVAVLRVERNEQVHDIVTGNIAGMEGISETETLIAFRTFSRHDLEKMFSIGFEEGNPGSS
ncbi:MAG: Lrp/AsnC family transcriptional regulator [Candidatus Eisenbacteria bacterium]|nr:Lrp/AsnC family transcriptional regulator [Candidatus Eisenbacteria bacterium]